jgi:hypothetical protein
MLGALRTSPRTANQSSTARRLEHSSSLLTTSCYLGNIFTCLLCLDSCLLASPTPSPSIHPTALAPAPLFPHIPRIRALRQASCHSQWTTRGALPYAHN